MSLACLVCHCVDSPSHSLRSCSISSTDNNGGRCAALANCLARKVSSLPASTGHSCTAASTSKVTPEPNMSSGGGRSLGTPRLVRSHAVSRDLVRDWNFDEGVVGH